MSSKLSPLFLFDRQPVFTLPLHLHVLSIKTGVRVVPEGGGCRGCEARKERPLRVAGGESAPIQNEGQFRESYNFLRRLIFMLRESDTEQRQILQRERKASIKDSIGCVKRSILVRHARVIYRVHKNLQLLQWPDRQRGLLI